MKNQFKSSASLPGKAFHVLFSAAKWLLPSLACLLMGLHLHATSSPLAAAAMGIPSADTFCASESPRPADPTQAPADSLLASCTVTVQYNQNWLASHSGCVLTASSNDCGTPIVELLGTDCMPANGTEIAILVVKDLDGNVLAVYSCQVDGGHLIVVLLED